MKIVLLVIIFSLSACSSASERALVHKFAENLKEVVISNNRGKLKSLPVYPGTELEEGALDYILGDKNNYGITDFLKNNNINIKIYGPYSRKDSDGYDVYSVVYYDPDVISVNADGFFDLQVMKALWGNGVVETVLIVVNKEVLFHRTAFYYGAHSPWAGDY